MKDRIKNAIQKNTINGKYQTTDYKIAQTLGVGRRAVGHVRRQMGIQVKSAKRRVPNYDIVRYEIENPFDYKGWLEGYLVDFRRVFKLTPEKFEELVRLPVGQDCLAWYDGQISMETLALRIARYEQGVA